MVDRKQRVHVVLPAALTLTIATTHNSHEGLIQDAGFLGMELVINDEVLVETRTWKERTASPGLECEYTPWHSRGVVAIVAVGEVQGLLAS
jgi:hypothetical protein